jgi:hypothetical protein
MLSEVVTFDLQGIESCDRREAGSDHYDQGLAPDKPPTD